MPFLHPGILQGRHFCRVRLEGEPGLMDGGDKNGPPGRYTLGFCLCHETRFYSAVQAGLALTAILCLGLLKSAEILGLYAMPR